MTPILHNNNRLTKRTVQQTAEGLAGALIDTTCVIDRLYWNRHKLTAADWEVLAIQVRLNQNPLRRAREFFR